jgi:hypothetical protein
MELGSYNIGRTLKMLIEKRIFSPVENQCTLKLLMYIDKSKELSAPKKSETILTEVLKMYFLELCFRKKFFGILRYQKSVFIERDLCDLPNEVENLSQLIQLSNSLQEKDNPIRRKMSYAKIYLPHDILKLINE